MEKSNSQTQVRGLTRKKRRKEDGRIIIYYTPKETEES